MLDQIEMLKRTARTNLMMFRNVGTIGYKLRGLEALQKIRAIVANEQEETKILVFKIAA